MFGVIGLMVRRVRTHDVDYRRVGPARVLEIRNAVGETSGHMQQRKSGLNETSR